MIFDPSISVGTILNIVGLLVAAITLYGRTAKTLTLFEVNYRTATDRLDRIENEMERLTKVAETLALQQERLTTIDKRFDELSSDSRERRVAIDKRFEDLPKTYMTRADVENIVNELAKPARHRKPKT